MKTLNITRKQIILFLGLNPKNNYDKNSVATFEIEHYLFLIKAYNDNINDLNKLLNITPKTDKNYLFYLIEKNAQLYSKLEKLILKQKNLEFAESFRG